MHAKQILPNVPAPQKRLRSSEVNYLQAGELEYCF